MGSLSLLNLLLLLAVPLALWLLIRLLRPNRLLRLLSRLAEGRHFLRADRPPPKLAVIAARSRLQAVAALLLVLTTAPGVAVFLAPTTPDSALALAFWLSLYLMALGVVQTAALIAAVIMHLRPNSNRATKYAVLLLGVGLLPVFVMFNPLAEGFVIRDPYGLGPQREAEIAFEIARTMVPWMLAFQPALWIAFYELVFRAWFRRAIRSPVPPGFTRQFRILRRTSTIAIVASSISILFPLSTALLIWRFHAFEAARLRPIVFLRSFRHAKTVTVFGSVVSKIASRYGVLVAIVHATQRGSDLFAETDAVNRAATATVADDAWQAWVETQLGSASAVIIDRSQDTEGVRWEIGRAMERVPISRVALLHEAAQSPLPLGTFQLGYKLDRDGIAAARAALDVWFRSLVAREQPPPLG